MVPGIGLQYTIGETTDLHSFNCAGNKFLFSHVVKYHKILTKYQQNRRRFRVIVAVNERHIVNNIRCYNDLLSVVKKYLRISITIKT